MNINDIKYPTTEAAFIELLEDYNDCYRKSLPKTALFGLDPIADENYDAVVEDFRAKFPESTWFDEIELEEVGENAITHSSPMLSTEKFYTSEALAKWFKRVEDVAHDLHLKAMYKVTCKLDGFAGCHETEKLSTRGDGIRGNDITYIYDKGVIRKENAEGRGELVIDKTYFADNLATMFPHPRNMMSSVLSQEDTRPETQKALDDGAIHFVPYTTLQAYVGTADDILANLEQINNDLRAAIPYLIDGFVIESIVPEIKEYMGYNNHHNKWQCAFKERGETAQTTVLDVKLQVGRTGTITPVLAVAPVLVSGATISNVTAHHMNNVRTNKMGVGAVIEIIRSGEVIPKIEKVITQAEYEVPTNCPCCNTVLEWESHFLFCPNHSGCSEQISQTLLHFFATLANNDGFGGKTVAKLVEAGFDTLEKIYAMKEQDFLTAGFGKGESPNLVAALETSKSSQIEDWRFLAAFGISSLGKGDSKKLLKVFNIDALHEVEEGKLIKMKGYGPVNSVLIPAGIQEKLELINTLRPLFNLELSSQAVVDNDSPFSGKNVVVTGTMVSYSRKEIEAFFTSKGAKIQSKASKTTQILVYGESAGSKLADAQALKAKGVDIEILTEAEFVAKYIVV